MKQKHIAMACKLMPYYRLGIFQKLSTIQEPYQFDFFGDTKEQGGIKQIPYSYASAPQGEKINWIKTSNYFYIPERLLWQTGIISRIFGTKYKAFVFEGAIAHLPTWLFAFLCKLRGKKVVYWTHGNRGLDKGIKKALRVVYFRWLGDALFLYGHHQCELMIEDGYDPDKIHVIYNSLQPEKQFAYFDKYQNENITKSSMNLFPNPELFTLIFIGRLAPSKQVLDILKAMQRLKESGKTVNCIFIGKGPEKEKMDTYVKEYALEDYVHFTGAIYEEEKVAPYFMVADMMMSPGNVGLNCIHSLAYGVPVLTHDNFTYQNPEVEAITNGVSGIFYAYGNFEDMVQKLEQWINAGRSKEEVVENCQRIIKDVYNPTYQAQCMVQGLNSVLK